jgi:hypothetical protein
MLLISQFIDLKFNISRSIFSGYVFLKKIFKVYIWLFRKFCGNSSQLSFWVFKLFVDYRERYWKHVVLGGKE